MENFDTYINNIGPDSRHPLYRCAECVKRCLRHLPGRLLAIVISGMTALAANATQAHVNDVERLVAEFEQNPDNRDVANAFFDELRANEFLDDEVVLTPLVPMDSVRQMVYYWAGEWFVAEQNYARGRDYGLKALPLYHGDSEDKAYCLKLLGVAFVRLGDFASGIKYTKECVDLNMRSGDDASIASSLNTLAGTYLAANDADAALDYALQGLQYAERCPDTVRKAILMGMASEACSKKGDYEQAVAYARAAYEVDSVAGRFSRAAIRLSQEATALVGAGKYEEAKAVFLRAIPILEECGNKHSLAIDYNQMGFLLLKQDRSEEAIPYFRQASELFGGMGDLYNQVHSQQGLYESYWTINPDSARIALDRFSQLKDSLYQQSSADALARYKAEFETDRLKEEVRNHRRDITITIVVLLVYIIGGFLFYRWRIRRYRREMRALIAKIEEIRTSEQPVASAQTNEPPVEETSTVKNTEFERKVIEAVNEGLPRGEYSVAHIASCLKMSEQTFRRRLVEATGKLPKDFISAVQMERAVALLKGNNDKTITEVARECGFEEASAFSRSFKRSFDCSPSEFRADAGKPAQ